MGALRFIGFLLIAGLVIAGLDYSQQDKKAEGRLSFGGYVDTVNDRFGLYKAEQVAKKVERDRKSRWDEGSKPHLPSAPAGWSRHGLTETESAPVQTVLSGYQLTPLISSISSQAELQRLSNAGRDGLIRKLAETSYVYVKDNEILWLDIAFKRKQPRNTLVGLALGRQANFMNAMELKDGFAVLDGVPFVEVREDISGRSAESDVRKIKGRIGFDEEIVIRLHSNASDETIRALLAEIDLAALNALLQYPSPATGQGIDIALEQQAEMADKSHRLYQEMKLMQERTTQDKLENMDMGAVMLNTLVAADFDAEGLADITGGKVFENQDNLQMAHGKALEMLLRSDQRQAAAAPQGKGFLRGLMDKLPKFGSGGGTKVARAGEVRVRKGGAGASSCNMNGSLKRCSIGDN